MERSCSKPNQTKTILPKRKLPEVCGKTRFFVTWNFSMYVIFPKLESFPILSTLDIGDIQRCVNCGFWTNSKAHLQGSWPHHLVFPPVHGNIVPLSLPLSYSAKWLHKVPSTPYPTPTPPHPTPPPHSWDQDSCSTGCGSLSSSKLLWNSARSFSSKSMNRL